MLVRIAGDMWVPTRQTPNLDGRFKDIEFTDKPIKDCDLVIVYNRNKDKIDVNVPDGGLWLFTSEPPTDLYQFHKEGYPYYDLIHSFIDDGSINESQKNILEHSPMPWYLEQTYSSVSSLELENCSKKKDAMSALLSSANTFPGHKFRQRFISHLNDNNFSFEHFGFGYNYIEDKFDGIFPYKYSAAIENSRFNNYWTEKIGDCFLSLTMPIYWGCPNILDFFPKESMILIDENDLSGTLDRINTAISTDLWNSNRDAIFHSRDLVLNKYSFFPHLYSLIKKHYNPTSGSKRRIVPPTLTTKEKKLSYKVKTALGVYKLKKRIRRYKWKKK